VREFHRPGVDEHGAVLALLAASDLPAAGLGLAQLAHFRVARDGEGVAAVGGFEAHGQVGLLRSLAVRPARRGEGLATRLCDCLEDEARRLGLEALYLLTASAPDFFERRGYTRLPRERLPAAVQATAEAARLCPASAVCMRKSL
jgi:amino-acid N-acetyltransferase